MSVAVEGYAALFDVEDYSGDVVRPGAFSRSLAFRGAAGVRMLFQHVAAEPVGVWDEMREDARGLYVRGRVLTSAPRGMVTATLVREGAVDGLSIGFRTIRFAARPEVGRELLELDLWEVSIVTFPTQRAARIKLLDITEEETTPCRNIACKCRSTGFTT